jgi:hypothetical protein
LRRLSQIRFVCVVMVYLPVETDGFQVHPTSGNASQSTSKTHALNDGEDSIVPKKIQEILPESVERAVPNAIHNTGDKPATK